jgi:hypothetical protein
MVKLELLVICWAAKKCASFIDCLPLKNFEIWTHHAPLIPILNKYTLPEIENKHLQRLRAKLDHLQFNAVWIKGKDNTKADVLSRIPYRKARKNNIVDNKDDSMSALMITTVDLFKGSNFDYTATPLKDERWSHRESLSIDNNGFIVKNGRLLVPAGLCQTYLQRLLAMHQPAEKMEARAKRLIWWPFITRDIKNIVKTCLLCQEKLPSQAPEPERTHEEANYPFHSLQLELASYEGRQFLILTDQFSGFPHICECGRHATTKQVTDFITLFITMYSVLVFIYSNGCPHLKDKFGDFCKKCSIKHNSKSSPHYPQSNGVAESAVKEMKKIIWAVFDNKRRTLDKSGLAAAMLIFQNTPRSPTDLSPAQLVFGRHLTYSIPFSRQMLHPQNQYQIEKRHLKVRENQCHK